MIFLFFLTLTRVILISVLKSNYSFRAGKLISILGKQIADFDCINGLKNFSWSSLNADIVLTLENSVSSKTYKIIKL